MKRATVLLMLLCMLTVTASAAYVPEEVVSENRDGKQLIIKTYTLPPDADPSELIEEPFELEGYTYHHLSTVKEEQAFKTSKVQTEVITLETETDDLAKILEQLEPTMEYSKNGFSGTLTLDHTTIQTEAAGYPAGDASVELPNKLAHKLAGRIITIQMYGGSRTHLVEPFEGDDNYWFAINEDEKEDDEL